MSYALDSHSPDDHQRVADFNHFVIFDLRNILACHDFEYIDLYPDPDSQSCNSAFNRSETASVVERDPIWHHLAVTWTQRDNGMTKIYLDGLLMTEVSLHPLFSSLTAAKAPTAAVKLVLQVKFSALPLLQKSVMQGGLCPCMYGILELGRSAWPPALLACWRSGMRLIASREGGGGAAGRQGGSVGQASGYDEFLDAMWLTTLPPIVQKVAS